MVKEFWKSVYTWRSYFILYQL